MGEFDLSLIREFRSRPGFYDRNSPLFKDKVYNAREWQQIANKLGYDVSLLKDRMLQLRNRYNLEKRRLEQLHEENPGKHLESPWPLFEELTFLSEHIRARRSYKRLVPTISSSPQKYFPDMPNQVPQKLMLTDQDNSQDQLDMLEQQQQQQLYNQQFYNNHAAAMSPNTSANASADAATDASNAAARFAANGLLTVKMEEEDADEEDDAQQQDYSEDNLENLNGDGADTDVDMSAAEAQQTQKSSAYNSLYQKQQQPQQQQKRMFPGSTIAVSSKLHSASSSYQHHGHAHKGKRFYLPSINKHRQAQQQQQQSHQQQQQHHSSHHSSHSQQQQQLQQHNHHQQLQQHIQRQKQAAAVQRAYSAATSDYMAISADAAFMDKQRILSAREQKFVAFGRFMTSALLDLPQHTALLLLEKFTSEVVKGLLQKHNSKSSSSSSSNNNHHHHHHHNDNNNHSNNNHSKSAVAAETTSNDTLDNSVLTAGMSMNMNMNMSGLGLTDMVNVPNINLSLLTNGDGGSIEDNH